MRFNTELSSSSASEGMYFILRVANDVALRNKEEVEREPEGGRELNSVDRGLSRQSQSGGLRSLETELVSGRARERGGRQWGRGVP